MATPVKRRSRMSVGTSYSGRHPDLAHGMPVALRKASRLSYPFSNAHDPYLKKQREAMQKTEEQRREEAGSGLLIVPLNKPFPVLKPKLSGERLRQTFNRNILKEQQRDVIAYFKEKQQQIRHADNTNDQPKKAHNIQR
ncbi:MAG: hypothetical protein ACRBBR_06610 [Cellvibrionaceae bacterium]